MKKYLAVFLCVMMLFTIINSYSMAETAMDTHTSGQWVYGVLDDGTAIITFCKINKSEITVPDTLDGKTVTAIRAKAFKDSKSLMSVQIPESVVSIEENPFAECKNLTKIVVSPDHPCLATIDGVLFSKPDKRLICYPRASTSESYEILQGIQVIGKNAFSNCEHLKSIIIPDSVTDIGFGAFIHCTSLTSVNIPDHVTNIGDWAFAQCSSLPSITIPGSVMHIGETAFKFCTSLAEITISEGVASIGNDAFGTCKSLSSITIPDSVTSIGSNPFTYCEQLTEIIVSPDHPYLETTEGVLFNKSDKCLICYPCAFTSETYEIPEGTLSIGNYAFNSCNSLKSVVFPDSLTSIGKGVFFTCSSLTSISIPNSVTSIDSGVFYGCDSLTVTVPRDSYAKQYCEENNVRYAYSDSNDWLNN